MNGKIKKFALISDETASEFHDGCNKIINEYQKQGLYVEVQYSAIWDERFSRKLYSAMIFGRDVD